MKLPRLLLGSLALLAAGGCQSLREQMLAANYPPTFVDGFEAGCSSGRSAVGPLGQFSKDVPRYLRESLYAQGWDDGFRQCESAQRGEENRETDKQAWRDRQWRHQVAQAMAKALTRNNQDR